MSSKTNDRDFHGREFPFMLMRPAVEPFPFQVEAPRVPRRDRHFFRCETIRSRLFASMSPVTLGCSGQG